MIGGSLGQPGRQRISTQVEWKLVARPFSRPARASCTGQKRALGHVAFRGTEPRRYPDVPHDPTGGVVVDTITHLSTRFLSLSIAIVLAGCVDGSVIVTDFQEEQPLDLSTATLEIVSGDDQVGIVAEPASQPLRVRVLDAAGAALPSAPVEWTFGDGQGSRAGATTTSTTLQCQHGRERICGGDVDVRRASGPAACGGDDRRT